MVLGGGGEEAAEGACCCTCGKAWKISRQIWKKKKNLGDRLACYVEKYGFYL